MLPSVTKPNRSMSVSSETSSHSQSSYSKAPGSERSERSSSREEDNQASLT